MILFDWGTYNGLSKLRFAATLGMRLTEIPPRELTKRGVDEDYFRRYGEEARKIFTTVTAHAPYYNVVSVDKDAMERSWRGLIEAGRLAVLGGAMIYNLHLGWRAYMDDRDLNLTIDFVKKLLDELGDEVLVSIEVPYTRHMLGLWDEIEAIRREVGGEKVIASLQLENVWMLEKNVYENGDFIGMDRETDKDFWIEVLDRAYKMGNRILSLRFSQIIGFKVGRKILKKRVPLGRGYPSLDALAMGLAEYMAKLFKKGEATMMHIIYTGPPETKYVDTLNLYSRIMGEAVKHL